MPNKESFVVITIDGEKMIVSFSQDLDREKVCEILREALREYRCAGEM